MHAMTFWAKVLQQHVAVLGKTGSGKTSTEKAEANCRQQGRKEAALLWRDAATQLRYQHELAQRALGSLRSFDAKLAHHLEHGEKR